MSEMLFRTGTIAACSLLCSFPPRKRMSHSQAKQCGQRFGKCEPWVSGVNITLILHSSENHKT